MKEVFIILSIILILQNFASKQDFGDLSKIEKIKLALDLETLIIDIGHNGGGTEGNESLLYSYFGENYQKYTKVVAKRQELFLITVLMPRSD